MICLLLFLRKGLLDQFFAPKRGEVIIADLLDRAPALAIHGRLNLRDLALDFLHFWILFGERGGKLRVLSLEVREIIKRYAKEGISVLLSSHNMLEIEFLSDRVALIDKGRILDAGTSQGLKDKYQAPNLEVVFRSALR